ncbi:MAG TPA: redox-sensing transcriptional repressor Rex [Candidatus Ozemobacteraceae bacterium]|nr:redox-sensing transcriptional repressor Rex [Candidatus Ozemobacteraceae bacterium]
MEKKQIQPPQATIRRLSVYLRCLNGFDDEGLTVVSSQQLADRLDLNPAQVRKDLAYFGEFGKRGVGYSVAKLRDHLIKILGLERKRMVAIVGAGGRLGKALASYRGFEKRNFKVVALFDKDPRVIGQVVGAAGAIRHFSEIPKTVKELSIEILILTVPVEAVDEVFELAQLSGVKAVLNFAPSKLLSTDEVMVHNVDLAMELESLSYHLSLGEKLVLPEAQ